MRSTAHERVTVWHHRLDVMGTVITTSLFDDEGFSVADAEEVAAESDRWFHHVDDTFSTWKPESPLSRLRRGEVRLDDVPADIRTVLELCRHTRTMTGGWFDPWAAHDGVDPTGLVKGWSAQEALRHFTSGPARGVIINAAGDIATLGGPTAGEAFRIGIADPRHPEQLWGVAEVRGAIATSGLYERGRHLWNPRTGTTEVAFASASVSGPDLAIADAWATALMVGGESAFERLEGTPNYEGLAIRDDGSGASTSEFQCNSVSS